MLLLAFALSPLAAADKASVSTALQPDTGRLIVDVHGVPPEPPVFFTAAAEQSVRLAQSEITSRVRLKMRVVQGRAETLTLGLIGDGEVTEVTGKNLRDWSVRQGTDVATGKRFLDLRVQPLPGVADTRGAADREFEFIVTTRLRRPTVPGTTAILMLSPGDAVGFSSTVSLQPDSSVDLRVTTATGMTALRGADLPGEPRQFFSAGEGRIEVRLTLRGAATAEAELLGGALTGRFNEIAGSIEFRLRGQLRAQKAGARVRVLSGQAALSDKAAGAGWHLELASRDEQSFAYELVAERDGTLPVEFTFAAAVRESGDWRTVNFEMPAGAIVPVEIEGLGDGVSFKLDARVVPAPSTSSGQTKTWQGFLPADGAASFAWKQTREAGESALAFTSFEQTEVRVGAGLLRQSAQISFRILQGKLNSLRCRLEGAGEIVGVEGPNVVGWKVLPGEGARVLEVSFSRPIENPSTGAGQVSSTGSGQAQVTLAIHSQTELGTWPVRAEPLRVTPEGGVRHSGFVRIANSGAVRLEVSDAAGMMQLAPAQFPGAAIEKDARQIFVYRFPSATYAYKIVATQIQPEVGVLAIATYELAETARVINASIELDVREAALREWTLRVPEDYTVVTVSGSDVSDYVAETDAASGTRALRILFGKPIEGRQLLQLRLEKNQPAAAGDWTLAPLQFPGAKTVRGHIGAAATPGYRIVPSRVDRLVEVPVSFFPKQTAGLQQAWRLREPDWTAEVKVEALGQSVQADVFHLYSLKQGVVSTSVLLNYFVVGAPANEWRVELPPGVGNVDVTGQNVRRDWRREGDQVIVSLHQPVLGAATLLITFEQSMSARGGLISPGQVRPLGVQAERGFIQVVSPFQVKHEIRRAEGGLLKLEPTELPAEFRLLTTSPSIAVYQYTARPFALDVGVEWYAPGETAEQVVDFAKLFSQVARDGQVVTEASFYVKTRGRKALRVTLPAGMQFWEARVDNEIVNARADGDQTLVPLPARANPNEPVLVTLRLGQPAPKSGSSVQLMAPRVVTAATVITEWTVRSDTGRFLVPHGGNAELLRPALTETGFEWISNRGAIGTMIVLSVIGLGALLRRSSWSGGALVAWVAFAIATVMAVALCISALHQRRPNESELTFAATIVPAGEAVSLQVANVAEWRTVVVESGVLLGLAGVAVLIVGRWLRSRERERVVRSPLAYARSDLMSVGGIVLLAAGLLAQRGGAVMFFGAVAAVVFLGMMTPIMVQWRRERRAVTRDMPPPSAEPGAGTAPIVSLFMIAGIIAATLATGTSLIAAQAASPVVPGPFLALNALTPDALPDGTKPAQAMMQTWSIRGERLFGEVDVSVRGVPGDSFLLLRPPAVLTEFKGDGLRVSKVERDGQTAYYVVPEREGTLSARVRFEMPITNRTDPIALPTGPAATQRVTLELDQAGWEFTSPAAVQVIPATGPGGNRSGATLVLAPHAAPTIRLQPRRRDPGAEATQFFVEAANLFLPGPGVVNGVARIRIRPVQGRVSTLELEIPNGLTVGEVTRGPVGSWRFDPKSRRLHVAIEPAQTKAFNFDVETQVGAGELPYPLALQPVRVLGATGDVGLIALAFGGDAQPEGIKATDLSAVNAQDFDASLLPRTREGQPAAALQNVWRYGAAGGRLDLKVAAVAPEVRVNARQVLSLDDDRIVMAVDLRVVISRVGVFKLSFALPEGLEVEALTGPALNHWTEAPEGNQRIVTLHLNGRTIGEQVFNLTLAGAAPRAQDAWPYPRLIVREAARQTGEALVVPGKGIRVRATDRDKVTQLDPRTVGGQQPGTLAFRLLQADWVLHLGIETLEPWVTVQALHEVTLREGQTLTRIAARYRVENAAVKQVQIKLPGLSEESARTVRATGSAVSDIVRVGTTPDTWEIRFQRGIAGETDVQIEFQVPAAGERGSESVVPPEFVGARQTVQFVAVRGGGRLELEAGSIPRGWTRIDWAAVPAVLQNRADRSVPSLAFRVAEPESALAVNVRRHAVAEALKLRVTQGDLLSLFAPTGETLTAVELKIDVSEKSTLRVRLPEGARLFNTFVNGESIAVVREGDAWLFHVAPNASGDRKAAVRLVYATRGGPRRTVDLLGPSLNVPLENVTWRVVIPPGYDLDDYTGALRLRQERGGRLFGVDDYVSLVSEKRSAEAKEAMSQLQQASSWMMKGEQDKAVAALSSVSNNAAIDVASNEDARVQLRNLKTQQAVLGLNTRRQRLYFDNRADTAQNAQLEQAASLNPFMQGKLNFDPRQADQLLLGNTAEENTALRGIAARIVDQQLAAEPAPGAIDVTLPERGHVLTFTRSLQVDGSAPLELKLDLGKVTRTNTAVVIIVLLALAAIAVMEQQRRLKA